MRTINPGATIPWCVCVGEGGQIFAAVREQE